MWEVSTASTPHPIHPHPTLHSVLCYTGDSASSYDMLGWLRLV